MSRINARLEQDYLDKLDAIKKLEHTTNTTQVLKLAIDEYYKLHVANKENKLNLLLNSDFIACGEGDIDLSANYKEQLSNSINKKYDNS